jgi:hypothetical protein
MGTFVNNLNQRIYRNDQVVLPGATFESDSDFDEQNFPSAEGYAFDTPEGGSTDNVPEDRLERISDVALAGRALSTAALRDKLDPETETTIKGTGETRLNNQPSAGGPAEILRDDIQDPNAPAPDNADDLDPREHTAPAVLERLVGGADDDEDDDEDDLYFGDDDEDGDDEDDDLEDGDESPESEVSVNFASPAAEKKAADLDVNPSSIKGTGKDGAITVSDVEKAAASD